jgi:Holliday junction DNA helicase RuvA
MIARLRGILIEKSSDGVVVDCGGVGYDVGISAMTFASLPAEGAEVSLRVFTHAQENRIALYGFATKEERQLFDLLITVKNVGPATAAAILSGSSSPQVLARLIAAGDLPGLVRIKGVGKKTADLMIVELKEKTEWLLATWGASGVEPSLTGPPASARTASSGKAPRAPILDDVASALVNLGWRPAEVEKVVVRLDSGSGATIEALLREALRSMPR